MTVEAETVEAALAEITAQFGENAEIMRAQKVHRGGVGGFFAKEMVQLTARRRRDSAPTLRPRPRPRGEGITDVLERMAQDADAEDSDFRTVLQREFAPDEAASGEVETTSAGFLSAMGWEESTADPEPTAPVEVDESAAVEPSAPDTTSTDDLPEPVAVGPALRSAQEPIVFPAETEPPPLEPESVDLVEPADGPVVPLPHPGEHDFDEAAVAPPETPAVLDPPTVELVGPTDTTADPALEVDDGSWRAEATVDAPEGMGAVAWSTTSLLRLGLPGPVISAVGDLDPNNDLDWIDTIAAAVAPHCGPLPAGDVIVVGPHAERLAEPLGLPLVRSGDMAPYDGSFCAMVEDRAEDRQWLEYVRGGRGIHLVVGDEPWQDLLVCEPLAVSWVGETAVADALYLAFTLGSTLGFGTVDGFVSSMVRAQPTDVALAVRRIVGRQ